MPALERPSKVRVETCRECPTFDVALRSNRRLTTAMSTLARIVSMVGVCFAFTSAIAADAPKDSPFGQAGTPATTTTALDSIDFAGVSTVGNRTMINLY